MNIRKPAATWVIIDEHPNSINDGWFLERPNAPLVWYDLPATYHGGAGVLSFADTHVEVRRWTDKGLLVYGYSPLRRDLESDDLSWLLERTTYE
jgi:prepilin-type processing-associated H-X9-DG protein